MTIIQALSLLKEYNEWRRGADIPMIHPSAIGVAIDTILELHGVEPMVQAGDTMDCCYTDWMGVTHNLLFYPEPCIRCNMNGGCHTCEHLLLTQAYKKFQQERLKIQ